MGTEESKSIRNELFMLAATVIVIVICTFCLEFNDNVSIEKTMPYKDEQSNNRFKIEVIVVHPADEHNEKKSIIRTTNLTTGEVEIRLNNPEDYCLSF